TARPDAPEVPRCCGRVSAVAGRGRAVTEMAGAAPSVTNVALTDDVVVLPVPEVAQLLSVAVSRVHQMVRDGQLLSLRRDGVACVPSDFFDGRAPIKGLSGTIMLLRDGGYADPD